MYAIRSYYGRVDDRIVTVNNQRVVAYELQFGIIPVHAELQGSNINKLVYLDLYGS